MRLNPVLEKLTPYRAGPPLAEVRRRYQLDRVAHTVRQRGALGTLPRGRRGDEGCAGRSQPLSRRRMRRTPPASLPSNVECLKTASCSATVRASF